MTPSRGLPLDGYTTWLSRMADHPLITVALDTDFFDLRDGSATISSWSTPGRWTGTSTSPPANSRGARWTSKPGSYHRGLPGHLGDELRR